MAQKSVFCIATSRTQADDIVGQLKSANFSSDDISVLFPDKDSTRDFAHEKNTKAPEGAVTGAGTGGVIGGALGWLAGIGALAIPGIGPFIAAGPIVAALSGAAVGAAAGGITGALIGMGIPEFEAKRFEGKVKAGNILISVHADSSDEIKRATGACVLTVHHIGRNGTDARGASAIDGAQDAELRIERTADRRVTIHMDKAKDADDAVKVELELLKVDGGVDPETLRDLSSLVVVPVGTLPLVVSKPWLDELVPNQAAIVGVIADHAPHAGATKPEVRALLAERYPMVRTSFNTAWDALIEKGIISQIKASQRWVLTSMVPVEPDLSSQHMGTDE